MTRIAFDDCCFGWVNEDRSFDPLPMPLEWRKDHRGLQIEQSRMKTYNCSVFEYTADARYPTREERLAPDAAYYQDAE